MWSLSKPTIQPEIPRLRTEIDEDRKKKKKHCNELHLGNVISCYKYGERHAKHRYDTAWMCEKRCEQIAADSPIYQTLTSQLLNQSRLLGPWCNINNQNVNSVQLYCEYAASGHIAIVDKSTFQVRDSENRKFTTISISKGHKDVAIHTAPTPMPHSK